jgi:hypothetical protein
MQFPQAILKRNMYFNWFKYQKMQSSYFEHLAFFFFSMENLYSCALRINNEHEIDLPN